MVWKELIPKIEFLLRRHPPPKFVVIQLGSNDLGTVKGWQLAENIICDILRIHALMPNTLIVWSDILQRRYWHNANNGKSIDSLTLMKSQHPPPCVRFDLSLNWRENKRASRGNKVFEGALNIV
jgi:hypothetical protein